MILIACVYGFKCAWSVCDNLWVCGGITAHGNEPISFILPHLPCCNFFCRFESVSQHYAYACARDIHSEMHIRQYPNSNDVIVSSQNSQHNPIYSLTNIAATGATHTCLFTQTDACVTFEGVGSRFSLGAMGHNEKKAGEVRWRGERCKLH